MSYLSGSDTSLKQNRSNERGAIMLEVIAVLALMGVMGAMLFRQIYQRNQELHNIQMASEIRTIKEAFSAYIQASRAQILSACSRAADGTVRQCGESPDSGANFTSLKLAGNIKPYLPDGWFADASGTPGSDLNTYYDFKLFTFTQNDITKRRMLYGVVIPKSTTLPATGWNFKRAARVALLVGADGGAFDPEITKDGGDSIIAGSLGSWSLMAHSLINNVNNVTTCSCPSSGGCNAACTPTYAAITGLDIFAPEYELPSVSVNLKNPWNLVLGQLGAANYFSVGGSSCYTIHHHQTDGIGEVKSDSITPANGTCQPLFWVGSGSVPGSADGNVYVQKDLRVGVTPGDTQGAIRLDDSGVIVMEKATVSDPQTSNKNITYLLDPQYTSVMNDIKIMSRGGAKLSDILPKYILKSVTEESIDLTNGVGTKSIAKPTDCPIKGYQRALVVIPTNIPDAKVKIKSDGTTGDVTVVTDHSSTGTLSKTKISIDQAQAGTFYIKIDGGKALKTEDTSSGGWSSGNWTVTAGFSTATTSKETGTVKFLAQTYCVWTGSGITLPTATRKAGNAASLAQVKTEAECLSYGGSWNDTSKTCS